MYIFCLGIRIAKTCSNQSAYFSAIDECIPLTIASEPQFLNSFLAEIPCSGGTVLTADDVEGLRFCTSIMGGLDIAVADAVADFTAVHDIKKIGGMDH